MKKYISVFLACSVLIIPHDVFAGKPRFSAYLDGKDSKVAVILCHGRGKGPKWKVVNPLRRGIHKTLGYHTLSLQMPANRNSWREYGQDFPKAYRTIQAGIDFLKKEKKVEKIYLMGHSMGSRMATAFLAEYPNAGIDGFIGVGIRSGGEDPMDSEQNLRVISLPVLDVYGNKGDGIDYYQADSRSDMVSRRYKQVVIDGADHQFNSWKHEKEMVQVVVEWLRAKS